MYHVKLLLQNSNNTTWHTKYYTLSHEAKKAYENMDENARKMNMVAGIVKVGRISKYDHDYYCLTTMTIS